MTGIFDGKVALITGGGTGIGKATALRMVERGGRVVVTGRREEPLKALAAEAPDRISYISSDLADWSTHDAAIAHSLDRFGRLDILVNNAALAVWKPFMEHSPEEIGRVLHVNLVSTAVLTQKAVPHLAAAKGNVVNISSAAGKYTGMPPQNLSAYGSSKAGLNHLTRLLAAELGPMGIRVNSVSPGTTMTEIAEKVFENKELVQANIAATPLGRVGMPIDIAKVICYLASEEADWVTGQIVDATGGYHMAL